MFQDGKKLAPRETICYQPLEDLRARFTLTPGTGSRQLHVKTDLVVKIGIAENYYTNALIVLVKILLRSKFQCPNLEFNKFSYDGLK